MSQATPYTFTIERDKDGGGWHVRVRPPVNQSQTVVSQFASEAEAQTWVDEESAEWVEHLEASRR